MSKYFDFEFNHASPADAEANGVRLYIDFQKGTYIVNCTIVQFRHEADYKTFLWNVTNWDTSQKYPVGIGGRKSQKQIDLLTEKYCTRSFALCVYDMRRNRIADFIRTGNADCLESFVVVE